MRRGPAANSFVSDAAAIIMVFSLSRGEVRLHTILIFDEP
jgi:hypothetical protein